MYLFRGKISLSGVDDIFLRVLVFFFGTYQV